MWLEREYFGAKPGQQTGSILVDDGRNIRQPLPSRSAYPPIDDWGMIESGKPWFPRPAGPWPMLPNPDSGGSEMAGITSYGIGDIELGPYEIDEDDILTDGEKRSMEEYRRRREAWKNVRWGSRQRSGARRTNRGIPPRVSGQMIGGTPPPGVGNMGQGVGGATIEGGDGTDDRNLLQKAWDAVKGFVSKALDSPLGVVAGVVAFAATAVALAVTAPVTLAGAAIVFGVAMGVGIATNLIVGGIDVATGSVMGNALNQINDGALVQGFRNARDLYITVGTIAETLGLVGGILTLGRLAASGIKKAKFTKSGWSVNFNANESFHSHWKDVWKIFKVFRDKVNIFRPDFWKHVRIHWHNY